MKTDKLELKHIAPYLPYGLKYIIYGIRKNPINAVLLCSVEDVIDSVNRNTEPITKLILRPLSDLYKEIDGVVHIVELAKIACRANEIDFSLKHLNRVANIVFLNPMLEFGYGNQEGFYLYDGDEERERVINQLNLFNYLFEHHFDVYGLIDKGLAIDINTI